MNTAIITGAYGKIGREISKRMAGLNFQLLLIGRDFGRLEQLKNEIKSVSPDCICNIQALDLSRKKEVYNLASQTNHPTDVLVNNAATAPRSRKETIDGIELQWATNVLGYYWMIMAFKEHLLKATKARIVNVASYWAGGLDLNDPEFKVRRYNNDLAYRQSKQANRQMSYGLADLFKSKISINACHPGDVNSKLSNDLGFGGSESAKKGAETPLILASTSVGMDNTGAYFEYGRLANCRFKHDTDQIQKLLDICSKY